MATDNKEMLKRAQKNKKIHSLFMDYMKTGDAAVLDKIIQTFIESNMALSQVFAKEIQRNPNLAREVAMKALKEGESKTVERLFANIGKWLKQEGVDKEGTKDHSVLWHKTETVKTVKEIAEDLAKIKKYVDMVPNPDAAESYKYHLNFVTDLAKKWSGEATQNTFSFMSTTGTGKDVKRIAVPMTHRLYCQGLRRFLTDLTQGSIPNQNLRHTTEEVAREMKPLSSSPQVTPMLHSSDALSRDADIVKTGKRLFEKMMKNPAQARETWNAITHKKGDINSFSEEEQALLAFDSSIAPDSIQRRIAQVLQDIGAEKQDKEMAQYIKRGKRIVEDALSGERPDLIRLREMGDEISRKIAGHDAKLTEDELAVYHYVQTFKSGDKSIADRIAVRDVELTKKEQQQNKEDAKRKLVETGGNLFRTQEVKVLRLWSSIKSKNLTEMNEEELAIKAYYDSLFRFSPTRRKFDKATPTSGTILGL